MGWLFETRAEREAREAAEWELVRRKRDRRLERHDDRVARQGAISRLVWGLWQSD